MEWLLIPAVALVFVALFAAISNSRCHKREKRAFAAGHGYGGADPTGAWFFSGTGDSHSCRHHHGHDHSDHGHSHSLSPDSHSFDAGHSGCGGGFDGGGCDAGGGGDGGGGGGD